MYQCIWRLSASPRHGRSIPADMKNVAVIAGDGVKRAICPIIAALKEGRE
jgi:hypothetical protein